MIQQCNPDDHKFLYHIDIKSFEWPWQLDAWKQINEYFIQAFYIKDVPRGYHIFQIGRSSLEVSKLCVNPIFRRIGLGSALLRDLVRHAIRLQKTKLCMTVHEDCQYFGWLANRRWKATGIIKAVYPDGTDGFLFEREVIS